MLFIQFNYDLCKKFSLDFMLEFSNASFLDYIRKFISFNINNYCISALIVKNDNETGQAGGPSANEELSWDDATW